MALSNGKQKAQCTLIAIIFLLPAGQSRIIRCPGMRAEDKLDAALVSTSCHPAVVLKPAVRTCKDVPSEIFRGELQE